MTDRIHSLTLVLDHDMRTDDVESLVLAASMLRGVLRVGTNVVDPASYMSESRAKHELRKALMTLLDSI